MYAKIKFKQTVHNSFYIYEVLRNFKRPMGPNGHITTVLLYIETMEFELYSGYCTTQETLELAMFSTLSNWS